MNLKKLSMLMILGITTILNSMDYMDIDEPLGLNSISNELQQYIISYVVEAQNLKDLIKNLLNLTCINRRFKLIAKDSDLINYLIKLYVRKYQDSKNILLEWENLIPQIKDSQLIYDITHALKLSGIDLNLKYKEPDQTIENTIFFRHISKKNINFLKTLINIGIKYTIEDESNLNSIQAVINYIDNDQDVISLLSEFIKNGIDINITNSEGLTALHISVECKRINIIDFLLENGAKIDIQCNQGNTPLMHGIEKNVQEEIISKLITYKSNLDIQNIKGKTALMLAIQQNYKSIIKILLKAGCQYDLKDYENNTILHLIINKCDILKLFLEKLKHSNCIDSKNKRSFTPLLHNINDIESVKILLASNADPNVCTVERVTPLLIAAKLGDINLVNLLLKYKANVNQQEQDGHTPLMIAAINNQIEVVKILLDNGANTNINNQSGHNCLYITNNEAIINLIIESDKSLNAKQIQFIKAMRFNNKEQVLNLIEDEVDINTQNSFGETVLMWAVTNHHIDIIEILLKQKNINLNLQNTVGDTALIIASRLNNFNIVKLLLNAQADPNILNYYQLYALNYAIGHGNNEIAELLLRANANPNLIALATTYNRLDIIYKLIEYKADVNFQHPLIIAILNSRTEIVDTLLNQGALINFVDQNGNTPLILAVNTENIEIIKLLLRHEISINHKNNDGNTALHIAAFKGNIDIIKILLEKNADYQIKNDNNQTPYLTAIQNNKINSMKFLHELSYDEKNLPYAIYLSIKYNCIDILKILIESLKGHQNYTQIINIALNIAVRNLNEAMVEYLIRCGANYNIKYENNITPLIISAALGYKPLVELLLKFEDLDINAQDITGNTALIWSIIHKHKEIAYILMDHQAAINIKNQLGQSALDLIINNQWNYFKS